MAQQDRRSMFRDSGGRGWSDRQSGSSWDEDRDENAQWGRHQPRQGGDFEDRYAGRGGAESRGNESTQRGRWRGQSYGQGRYERDDHLRAGGSYGGQYDEGAEDRYYSPHEGTSQRDFGRSQYGDTYYGGRDERGYGYDAGRAQEYDSGRRNFDEGSRDRQRRSRERDDRYDQGYGSQSYGSGAAGRYGTDYSMEGMELRGQWDRGFGEMSRGTSGGYQHGEQWGGSRTGQDYGNATSWTGGMSQPQRQSFRGRGPKGYERSDERLKEIICERLMEDPHIDASEISVEVRNREVTLQGVVDDRRIKYEVEELIERCGGVKEVKNELRVRARGSESGDTSSRFASSGPDYGTSGMSGISSGSSGSGPSGTSRGS